MIEAGDTSCGRAPADVVAGWVLRVQQLAADCADDDARIDLLAALESLKGAAAGCQAAVTVGFAATQTAEGRARGMKPELIRRSIAGQVALARRDAQHRGGRHVGLAAALHTELLHTRRALEDGRISEWQATLICRETACLDPDLRRLADHKLAPELGVVGDRRLAQDAARIVADLDAAAVADRARRAARDRRVTVRPAPDTMAYLTALLPATVAVAAYAALTSYTQLVVGEGDHRGRGQIMADTLVDRVTGGAITGCDHHGAPHRTPHPEDQPADADDAANRDLHALQPADAADSADVDDTADRALHAGQPAGAADSADADGPGAHDQCADGASPPGPSRSTNPDPDRYRYPTAADARAQLAPVPPAAATIHLHLIMTDRTLLGLCDEPADLTGYGPIPADLARALAAANLGPQATTVFRRFYTHPDTGQLAATDSTARRFPTVMQQFLLVRDRTCRTPYCHAPGRHHDHQHDHAKTGPTTLGNGQLTCQACNHTKQTPGWTVTTRDDGTIQTTTPTGHTYPSPPPTPPGAEHGSRAPEVSYLEGRLKNLLLEYHAA